MKKYGLINALTIDDADTSIDYIHGEVSNSSKYQKIINLTELTNLFREGNNPFKYDTRNAISLIFDDGTEHSIQEVSSNAIFLKITDYRLKEYDSEILIALDSKYYVSSEKIEWMQGFKSMRIIDDERVPKNDYGINNRNISYKGYECCQMLLDAVWRPLTYNGQRIKLKAVEYCNNLKINTLNGIYQGYLPTVKQIAYLKYYKDLLNYILDNIGFEKIPAERLWTCSEYNFGPSVWYLENDWIKSEENRTLPVAYALPFFKKI